MTRGRGGTTKICEEEVLKIDFHLLLCVSLKIGVIPLFKNGN